MNFGGYGRRSLWMLRVVWTLIAIVLIGIPFMIVWCVIDAVLAL